MSFSTLVSTKSAALSTGAWITLPAAVFVARMVGDVDDLSVFILDAFPAIVVVTEADDEVDFELAPEHDELELDDDSDVREFSCLVAMARCLIVPAFSLANGIWSIESMLELDYNKKGYFCCIFIYLAKSQSIIIRVIIWSIVKI